MAMHMHNPYATQASGGAERRRRPRRPSRPASIRAAAGGSGTGAGGGGGGGGGGDAFLPMTMLSMPKPSSAMSCIIRIVSLSTGLDSRMRKKWMLPFLSRGTLLMSWTVPPILSENLPPTSAASVTKKPIEFELADVFDPPLDAAVVVAVEPVAGLLAAGAAGSVAAPAHVAIVAHLQLGAVADHRVAAAGKTEPGEAADRSVPKVLGALALAPWLVALEALDPLAAGQAGAEGRHVVLRPRELAAVIEGLAEVDGGGAGRGARRQDGGGDEAPEPEAH